jgi:hypothetical protein
MPTPTYKPLATITLGSAASTITFGSIPGTYRDLVLFFITPVTASAEMLVRFNGDTASNYSYVQMVGFSGGATSATNTTTGARVGFSSASNATDNAFVSIMDYTATDKHKTLLIRGNSNQPTLAESTRAITARWANTSAITTLSVLITSGNFSAGSTFSLYGIVA